MSDLWVWLFIGAGVALGLWVMHEMRPKLNDQLVCPHCHSKGTVYVGPAQRKRGISGGKATGALLTGGFSLLLVGLSRKQLFTHLSCTRCGMEWDVE